MAGLRPKFVLAVPEHAAEARDLIRAYGSGVVGTEPAIVEIDEPNGPDVRHWAEDGFDHMVMLRNQLLHYVRNDRAPLYWSLDSDILVDPMTLCSAIELLEKYDAIGTKLYMEPVDTASPSYMGYGMVRSDAVGEFPVEVIMASKIMTPPAYAVDYQPHSQGEDVGWSIAARAAGLKLGWDGRVCSKHVMRPADLDRVDPRIGW